MFQSEPRILILDDDPNITDLLSDILQQEGYKVMASNSPKDVLFLARQFRPDVLLLDIMMPEMDGFDVCEYFKKDAELKLTRIIILTARDDRECRVRSYKARADLFLGKPFELDELREAIISHIHSKIASDQVVAGLRTQTIMDGSMNCYHRKYMERRIVEELKRLERAPHHNCVLLLDLDNFNTINMKYGYAFGDEVLNDVVEAVRQELREFDLMARHDENAFLILLPDTPMKGAKVVASRINEVVSSLVFLNKKKLTLYTTVVAIEMEKGQKLENVFGKLEAELKTAKARKVGKLV